MLGPVKSITQSHVAIATGINSIIHDHYPISLVLFPIQDKQHFIDYQISNGGTSKGQRKGDRKRQSEWTSEMSIHTSRAGTCVSNSMLIHSMSNSRFRSKPATSSLFYIHNTYTHVVESEYMRLRMSICVYTYTDRQAHR